MAEKKKFDPHAFGNSIEFKGEPKEAVIFGSNKEKVTLGDIYGQLSANFEEDVVEKASKELTKKGYDTTGIKYQAVVDRFNDVLTPFGWNYKVVLCDFADIKTSNGYAFFECTIDLAITVLEMTKTHTGSHTAKTKGDAKKGAITNALKKCAAMFGVGRQAYLGTLDDDNLPVKIDARPKPPKEAAESQQAVSVAEYKVTDADLDSICPIGRAPTKGKKFSEIPDSTLSLMAKLTDHPKESAIAREVLRRKKIDVKVAEVKAKYPSDGNDWANRLDYIDTRVKGFPYQCSEEQFTFALGELTKMNDGMTLDKKPQ